MHRVICVSTPFIRVFQTPDEWRTSFAIGLRSGLAFSILAFALQFGVIRDVPSAFPLSSPIWTLLVEILCLAVFAFGSRLINTFLKIWANRAATVIADTGHAQLSLGQATLIRTGADEAGYVLGLGATVAYLIERIAVSLLVIVPMMIGRIFKGNHPNAAAVTFLSTWVFGLSAIFVVLSPASTLTPVGYAVLFILGIVVLPNIVMVALVLLLSLCYLSFGRDLAVCTPFLRATAEAAPSGIWKVFQFPSLTALPLFRLQHSFIYEYSALRLFMARWLTTGEYISMRGWRER